MQKIKAVLWDIDGTLLNFLKAEEAGIKSCFARFGLGECTEEMLKRYSEINIKYWQRLERGEMSKADILIGRFREFFEEYGLDISVAADFNNEYQVRLGDTICFEDNALETVKALRGKVIQCAVTNGTKLAQERKLKNSGLGELFEYVFISEEVGAEKPAKEFFDRVLAQINGLGGDKCGTSAELTASQEVKNLLEAKSSLEAKKSQKQISPQEILIVGDSLTSDMRGGVNAGLRTCWFNPKGSINDKGLAIDYEIKRIDEVLNILRATKKGFLPGEECSACKGRCCRERGCGLSPDDLEQAYARAQAATRQAATRQAATRQAATVQTTAGQAIAGWTSTGQAAMNGKPESLLRDLPVDRQRAAILELLMSDSCRFAIDTAYADGGNFYYLRMRTKCYTFVGFEGFGECIALTPEGCSLGFEDRPLGGRSLKSSPDFHCHQEYGALEMQKDWEPYNEALAEIWREYTEKFEADGTAGKCDAEYMNYLKSCRTNKM